MLFFAITDSCPDLESRPDFTGSNVAMSVTVPHQNIRALILDDIYCNKDPESNTVLAYLNVINGEDYNSMDGWDYHAGFYHGTE